MSSAEKAIELVSKVIGVLAALLGTAGYVLVLGAAILWLRLKQVDLPPEVPVSIASREELIALGAQAVAVWVLMAATLGGLAAWIVTGDPKRRRFGYAEAGLALAITVSALFGFVTDETWMLILPGGAAVGTLIVVWWQWPSIETATATLLPIAVGFGLAAALPELTNSDGTATAIGIAALFGLLMLIAPGLQRWHARQESNEAAIAQLKAEEGEEEPSANVAPIVEALAADHGRQRSRAIVWIERIAGGAVALVVFGVIAIASQLDRHSNFHEAVVSLGNGDCIRGTYVVRGATQLVLAHPNLGEEADEAKVTVVPLQEVLEVQVYGETSEGSVLSSDPQCAEAGALVKPKKTTGP